MGLGADLDGRAARAQLRLRGVTARAYNQRMSNLNLHVTVPADRRVVVQLPDEVDPGEADITVIVRKRQTIEAKGDSLSWFPTLNVSQWDPSTSLRREDMYGDDER